MSPPAPIESRLLEAPYRAPRSDAEGRIAAVWGAVLGQERVSVDRDFFALGGDSLLAVRLAARLWQELGLAVPLAELVAGATVERLAAGLAPSAGRLIVLQAEGERSPLVLVHPVGGDVFAYRALANHLAPQSSENHLAPRTPENHLAPQSSSENHLAPQSSSENHLAPRTPENHLAPGRPLWALRSPGLEPDETLLPTIAAMAGDYVAALRAARPHGPYVVGGWSMGAMVAWEMARRLAGEVEAVVLIEPPTPGESAFAGRTDAELAIAFARHLGGLAGLELEPTAAEVDGRSRDALVDLLAERARDTGVLGTEVSRDAVARTFAVFCNNARALAGYLPGTFSGRLILVQSEASDAAKRKAAAWSALTTDVASVRLGDDHFAMLREPLVADLATQLEARLADFRRSA